MWAALASQALGGGGGGGASAGDSRETNFGDSDQEFSTGQRFAIGGNPNLAFLDDAGAASVLKGGTTQNMVLIVGGLAAAVILAVTMRRRK